MRPIATRKHSKRWYWLLILTFIAMLWPPFFNSMTPVLAGIPFFYWYQFTWVILSGFITGLVYVLTRTDG